MNILLTVAILAAFILLMRKLLLALCTRILIRKIFAEVSLNAPSLNSSLAPAIRVVDGGFDLVSPFNESMLGSLRWSEVAKIQTYKEDLITTDCIWLMFEFRDGKPWIQVSERYHGFPELFSPISEAFPSIPKNWYLEVMAPAFELNHKVLYESTIAD